MGDDLLSVRGRGSLLKSLSQDSEYSLDSSLFDAEEFLRDMGFAGAADPSIPDRFLPSLLQRLSRFPEAEMDSLHHRIVQSIGCFRRKEGKRRLFRNLSSGRTPHLPCPSYPLLRSNTGPAAFSSSTTSLPRDIEEDEDDVVPHSPIAILVSAASTEESQFDSGQASVDLEDSEEEEGHDNPDDSGCFSVDPPRPSDEHSEEVDSSIGVDFMDGSVKERLASEDLAVDSVVGGTQLPDHEEQCEPMGDTTECFSSHSKPKCSVKCSSSSSGEESNDNLYEITSVEINKSCERKNSGSFHRPVERQNGKNFYFSELEAVSKGMELLKTDKNVNSDALKNSVVEQSESDNSDDFKGFPKDFKSCETAKTPFKSSSNAFSNLVMEASELARKKLELERTFQDIPHNTNQLVDSQTVIKQTHNDTSNHLKCSISAKESSDNLSTNLQQTVKECIDIPNNVNQLLTAKDYVDSADIPTSVIKETVNPFNISDYSKIGLQKISTECTLNEVEFLLSDTSKELSPKSGKENLDLFMPYSVTKNCKKDLNEDELSFRLEKETSSIFPYLHEKDVAVHDSLKKIKALKNPLETPTNSDSLKEIVSEASLDSAFGSFNSSSDGNNPVVVKHPLRRTSNSNNNFCFKDSYPIEFSSDLDSKEIKEAREWSSLKTSLRSSFDDGSADERSKSEDLISDSDSAAECLLSIKSSPSTKLKCAKEDSLTSFLSSMLDTTGKKYDSRNELSVESGTVKAAPNRKRRVLKRMSSSMQCCDEPDCRHHDGLSKHDPSEFKHEETPVGIFKNTPYSQNPPSPEMPSDTPWVLPNSSPERRLDAKNSLPHPNSCVEVLKPKLALRNTNSAPLTSEANQSLYKVNFSPKSNDFFRRKDRRPCKRRRYLSCPFPNNFNFVPEFNMKKFSSSLRDIHSPECNNCQEFGSFSDSSPEMSIRPRPGFYSPRGCSPVRNIRSSDPPWASSFPSRLSSRGHYLYNSSPDIHGSVSPELVRVIRPRLVGTPSFNEFSHQDEICPCHCDSIPNRRPFRFPPRQNSMSYPDSEAPFAQSCLDRCCSPLPSRSPGHFSPERHRRSEFFNPESHFRNNSMFLNKCQNFQKRPINRKISAPDYPFRSNVCQYNNYNNCPQIQIAQHHSDDSRSDANHQSFCPIARSFPPCQHESTFLPTEFDTPFIHNSSGRLTSGRPIRQSSDVLDCRCQNCSREYQSWRFSNLRDSAPSGHSEASFQYRTSDVFCERDRFSSGHFPSESLPETPYKVASHSDSELNDCSLSASKNRFCKHHSSEQFSRDGFPPRRKGVSCNEFKNSSIQTKDISNPRMKTSEKKWKASDGAFQLTSQIQQNRSPLSDFEKPLLVHISAPKTEPISAPTENSNPFNFELKKLNNFQAEEHLKDSAGNTQNLFRTETKRPSSATKNLTKSSSEERNPINSALKSSIKNPSQVHSSQRSPQEESDNLLQVLSKHSILKRSISENPPTSLSCHDPRSKSSPPSPDNKREAMFEKKIRIFSKFLTNLGNLSNPSPPAIRSLSSSLPDNSCPTLPPSDSERRCVTPPPVLSFHHPPKFENRVLLEADGNNFQPVLYTSTVSMFVNGEEDDIFRKRDTSSKSNSKNNSPKSSPKPFNVVSKELEDLQISIQKAKEMRLSASKELHLLQALLSREDHTKEKRYESSLGNSEGKGLIQMKKSETLQELKDRKDHTEEAAYWKGEVERARKETEEAWAEKLSRMSAQLSLQEAELQRLQKGISTESLQDAVLCPQCSVNPRAATEPLHHNGRTDSAFEDDEEYKPSIPIQSTRQECERLRERLAEEEQRADQLNLLLHQRIIDFNKLQLTHSKQTKDMIELEKSYLQLQCRMRRGSHRPRLCSREGLICRGQTSPTETPQN